MHPAAPPTCPCPCPLTPPAPQTILDGEMVVDELLEEGRQERRFLAYDLVMDNGRPMGGAPFLVRRCVVQEGGEGGCSVEAGGSEAGTGVIGQGCGLSSALQIPTLL